MAVTGKLYSNYPLHLNNGAINFPSDTIKCALCTSTYTPNQSTHKWFSDITNEITGTGYTAGGATLTTKTNTVATTVNTIDADDPSWTTATFTARYAVFYKSTGTSTTSPLIGYLDFGADQTVSAGAFTIQLNASGLAQLTVS